MTPAHHAGRRFRNIEPASEVPAGTWLSVAKDLAARHGAGRPAAPVPVEEPSYPAEAAALAVTWLGHASVLLEVDGFRVLADPMASFRASPVAFTGPARLHRPPLPLARLPRLDAIVISHDHYDHLDRATIAELVAITDAPLCVPLGIGRILRSWGVPGRRVVELDWHGRHRAGELTLTCTPARHFSGRTLARNTTLWASWAIAGPRHRVYFGGDTGYTPAFTEIGERYGPFQLTALPIGAYDAAWPDIHMTPEEAARAHRDLGGGALLPIHWATFDLARHPYAEPIERLLACDLPRVLTPPPGRRLVLDSGGADTSPGLGAATSPGLGAASPGLGAAQSPGATAAATSGSTHWWR